MTRRAHAPSLGLVVLALLLVPTASGAGGQPSSAPPAASPAVVRGIAVVATGLAHPRGFAWDAAGTLHVALAGTGGPILGDPPVAPPLGPFSGGKTASVVRIEDGCPVPLATGLPSAVDGYGNTYGGAALAFLDGRLYALFAAGGAVNGNPGVPGGVYEVHADGTTRLVADIGAFIRANPVAGPLPWDYGPEGEPFAMIAHGGTLWVVESGSGQLLTIAPDGGIERVADLSAGHPVPTGLAAAPDGGVYVGFLTPVPFPDGAAKVVHITPAGTVTDVWTGLTAITALAVGPDGALYALEMATGNLDAAPWFRPWTGRLVRRTGPTASEALVTGLLYPVAMAFGPDGGLYVAYPGIGIVGGNGVIVRVDVTSTQPLALDAVTDARLRTGGNC